MVTWIENSKMHHTHTNKQIMTPTTQNFCFCFALVVNPMKKGDDFFHVLFVPFVMEHWVCKSCEIHTVRDQLINQSIKSINGTTVE